MWLCFQVSRCKTSDFHQVGKQLFVREADIGWRVGERKREEDSARNVSPR